MPKASHPDFANAKRRALRALAQQAPDEFVPDRVMFFNDELGFIFRLSNLSDDHHYQRIVPWAAVEQAKFPIIEKEVSFAVERLARAQGESI